MLEFIKNWLNPMPLSLSYDDVAISQAKNIAKSRLDVDIQSEVIRGVSLDVPLIAANMSTVCDPDFCVTLSKLGAMGVLHRAMPDEDIISGIRYISKSCQWAAGSIGVGNSQLELAKKMILAGANILFIDIAHGYSDSVIHLAKTIKRYNHFTRVVAGNTVNVGLLEEAYPWIDAIKVGVGQGYACTTKNTAGCTEGQFSATLKFKKLSQKYGIPVISDGGIREPSHFVKAIAAGANSVMAGKMFAMCPESAAPLVDVEGRQKKIFAGMASKFVQNSWRGGLKPGTCSEGELKYLDVGEPAAKLIERYAGALKSGITYSGTSNIEDFQKKVKFIRFK